MIESEVFSGARNTVISCSHTGAYIMGLLVDVDLAVGVVVWSRVAIMPVGENRNEIIVLYNFSTFTYQPVCCCCHIAGPLQLVDIHYCEL